MFCIQNADLQKADCLIFFAIASTGIAEVTWRRAPIHTKIGRFSCCDFYSCNCPSLGIATDLSRNILPLATGMWDSGGEKRHREQEEPASPPIQGQELGQSGMEPALEQPQHWVLMGSHQGIQEMQTEPTSCLKGF